MIAATRRSATTISDAALAEVIGTGASALRLHLLPPQVDRLVAYLRLLQRWNATYNLTAIRDPLAMATQHIVDCLAVVGPLRERRGHAQTGRILDVGSGAGLPGIVLAVVEPGYDVTCIDSVGKKAAFIGQAAASLELTNLTPRHGRVEDLALPQAFDVVASRAFASCADFVRATHSLLAANGLWMAMKGNVADAELRSVPADVAFHVEPLRIPNLDAARCIVWMQAANSASERRL